MTKWPDINKGGDERPKYRARLEGCELKLKNHRIDLSAATPPLESLRTMCFLCASIHLRHKQYRLMAVDVKRACFYAPARREIYIEIPREE